MTKHALALFSIFAISGCAFGPLVNHETARTVGANNHELVGGYGQAGYVAKWTYGLAESLDLGVQFESLSFGIRGKYSFLNVENGFSLAAALGFGSSIGGSHYYGDILASYMAGGWEPYGTLRIVHVKTDPLEFRDEETGDVDFTIGSAQYEYGQFMLGTRYWFTEHWLVSIEASTLFGFTSEFKVANGLLAGAAFGYRF